MNIINKSGIDKDPFAQSDRGGFGKNAGKGDSNRSNSAKYAAGYAGIDWQRHCAEPISKCCRAKLGVAGQGTTHWHVCVKCKKPCQTI